MQFGYIAIETQEAVRIGHTTFPFAHLVLHLSTQTENEPAMSNTCHSFVSIVLYLLPTLFEAGEIY